MTSTEDTQTVSVGRERLRDVATDVFTSHGIAETDAETTARVLVTAEARGKHSHGLIRLPRYVGGIEHGNVDPDGVIEVVRDSGAAVTLSGGHRLGPAVAVRATAEAAARAEEYGIGCVGVHESTHLGMLGYYTDQLREEGMVGIAMTNTEPAMPPHGGTEPILGTNPIAIGLPTEPPFNFDASTAAIARGRLETAAEHGESIPRGVALDTDGEPTTDPAAALDGTILPVGGPTGSGLAIAIEVLAGGLVGASMGTDVTGTYDTRNPCTKGDLFVAIDPTAMGGPDTVDRIETFLDEVLAVAPGDTDGEVRLPGARSLHGEVTGDLDVDRSLFEELRRLAE
jgi:L-2-hydroxycarboxylate dehydrogenase (NAD+)